VNKTPLWDWHSANGGKMVEFAGWQLPIQYSLGIRGEHDHTRKAVGLFDVSHMGEFRVLGDKALETLEWVTTNSVAKLKAGEAQYSLFPNSNGGVVDDLIVYCIEPSKDYLLCVNGANVAKDWAFINENNRGAELINQSLDWGQIAVQGPLAIDLLSKVTGLDCKGMGSFTFQSFQWDGDLCYYAKTGYTGEDGGEIFVPWDRTESLWKALLASDPNPENPSVLPIGLGARDTLRMEMKYPLYGQELADQTNPYAAKLGWVVKPKEKDFLGMGPMLNEKEQGLSEKLVGLQIDGRGIARTGYKAFSFDKKEIGKVTSGTLSPSLNRAIAIAYLHPDFSEVGTKLAIEIRGKMVEAQVIKTPFYRHSGEDL